MHQRVEHAWSLLSFGSHSSYKMHCYPVGARTDIHWMSWITDHKDNPGTEFETICRVYGHRLSAAATAALSSNSHIASSQAMWMTTGDLEAALSTENGEDQQTKRLILDWLRMWVHEQDEAGNPVRRGFGVATGDAGAFINWVG